MLSNPYRLAETQMNLLWDYSALWQSSMLKLMGQSPAPVAEPAKSDKRFRHEDWQEHFLFDYVKQSYLLTARWLHDQLRPASVDDATCDAYLRRFTTLGLTPAQVRATFVRPQAPTEPRIRLVQLRGGVAGEPQADFEHAERGEQRRGDGHGALHAFSALTTYCAPSQRPR